MTSGKVGEHMLTLVSQIHTLKFGITATYYFELNLALSISSSSSHYTAQKHFALDQRVMMFVTRQFFICICWYLAAAEIPTAVLASTRTSCPNGEEGCTTKSTLDALAQLVGPLYEYNEADWNSLRTCLEENMTPEINLVEFSDAAWAGFLRYGESNGQVGDVWVDEQEFYENIPKPLPNHENITIAAPCYTTSNFPYYRSAVSVCAIQSWTFDEDVLTGLVQALTVLAWGSAFYHASWASLGSAYDVLMISQMSMTVYQAMVERFEDDSIIYQTQRTIFLPVV
jgi:hypothetical protein